MIKTTDFNRIRRTVMKTLAPEFQPRKNVYIREGEHSQIHCIRFTTFARDSEFSIEFGVHFSYIPSFASYGYNHKAIHPEPDTCVLKGGLKFSGSRVCSYGGSEDTLQETLDLSIAGCLRTLEEFELKWGNGDTLIDALSPQVMQEDVADFSKMFSLKTVREQDEISNALVVRRELQKFDPLVGPVCVMLAFIAKQHRGREELEAYLEILRTPGVPNFFNSAHKAEFLPLLEK